MIPLLSSMPTALMSLALLPSSLSIETLSSRLQSPGYSKVIPKPSSANVLADAVVESELPPESEPQAATPRASRTKSRADETSFFMPATLLARLRGRLLEGRLHLLAGRVHLVGVIGGRLAADEV